ncbi:SDR family NAD(P)-dependent oxidoreductase [Clostridiaceae bacterium M8S5]|nr:SDR family NAD(P)-dependent oxidoreductase [Clostridiaceae bacterium M8S5]
MKGEFFNINDLKNIESKVTKNKVDDIAIIGMTCKFATAENCKEYWQILKNGRNCIRSYPESRMKDAYGVSYEPLVKEKIVKAAYLDEIDKFDYEFFNISYREAKLIDPTQRIFLEAVWSTLEEAGYGGENIKGSNTGIYVGHSNDLRLDYYRYVQAVNNKAYENLSLPGNVRSVLAGRIAYILNLKGPSMVIDTACSSALVAIHLASKAIKNGDCDMAIAGGIKINLMPIQRGFDDKVGIRSQRDETRAFDEGADGFASGEGVGVLLLKSLEAAIRDKDNIHAVIKGSAVNQDGKSIGLTAPSAKAQSDVIIKAWKSARIKPETVSYIETHGTGTKLGDPIEINGIEMAFNKYTQKKGICAIGSCKTNLGHLDNAAGMPGIIKLILMLKNKQIAPTINFNEPNKKIDFIDSPVYVNDKLNKWEKKETPLIGGVSSFGLSGTNCHVVLEEYTQDMHGIKTNQNEISVFTLSAKDEDTLKKLAKSYIDDLKVRQINIHDVCYTSNIGRVHHEHRLAVITRDKDEMLNSLSNFIKDNKADNVFYAYHKIAYHKKKRLNDYEISSEEKEKLDVEASSIKIRTEDSLKKLCMLYVRGAKVDFIGCTDNRKVTLPLYTFKKNRCWVERIVQKTLPKDTKITRTLGQTIYTYNYSPKDDWVIGDHKVGDKYVMPGTAYIEMVVKAIKQAHDTKGIVFRDVVFIKQFALFKDECKQLQLILKEGKEGYRFTIASEDNGIWDIHVEGEARIVDLQEEKASIPQLEEEISVDKKDKLVITKGRWKGISKKLYKINEGYVAKFKVSDEYADDFKEHFYHPAMMDRSLNTAIDIIDIAGNYLPFNYKEIRLYRPLPKEIYSVVKIKNKDNQIATFDIKLLDASLNICVEAIDYSIKKVNKINSNYYKAILKYICFKPVDVSIKKVKNYKNLAVIGDETYAKELREFGFEVMSINFGPKYVEEENKISINHNIKNYQRLVEKLEKKNIEKLIYINDGYFDPRDSKTQLTLDSVYKLIKEITCNKLSKKISILYISKNAFQIKKDENINPYNTAIVGLIKVAIMENPDLKCNFIDVDDVNTNILIDCIKNDLLDPIVGLRNEVYYKEAIKEYSDTDFKLEYKLKKDGVYLITGGTGGLGLEVAKYISSKERINIALLARTEIPDRNKWEDVLDSDKDTKVSRVIKSIMHIEKNSSKVKTYSVDISNKNILENVIKDIRKRFSKINGIIHCAGVAGNGFIFRKDIDEYKKVLAPKVDGTINLDVLTREDNPDFMVMFSSINALIGGKGQGDYSMANAFMDGYSYYRNNQGLKTVSINWPAFNSVGMAYDNGAIKKDDVFSPIDVNEGLEILEWAFGSGTNRIVVGDFNKNVSSKLPLLIDDSIETSNIEKKQVRMNKKVSIKEEINEAYSPIEKRLSKIWAEVLMAEEVNIYDTFSSMGGDSILAIELYKKIDSQYPEVLDVTDVFNYPTVFDMAEYINKELNKSNTTKEKSDDLDELLSKLANGDITVSQADEVFKK